MGDTRDSRRRGFPVGVSAPHRRSVLEPCTSIVAIFSNLCVWRPPIRHSEVIFLAHLTSVNQPGARNAKSQNAKGRRLVEPMQAASVLKRSQHLRSGTARAEWLPSRFRGD